jgi:DNA-directed RNA polymerase, subunit M/Transcription elongation factor TFIIS
VTTRTKPSDFPSALRQKLSIVQTVERHEVQTERIDTNMDCPKCGKRGVRYSEVQQRSADEGSTIIYNCDCGERCAVTVQIEAHFTLLTPSQMDSEQLKTTSSH